MTLHYLFTDKVFTENDAEKKYSMKTLESTKLFLASSSQDCFLLISPSREQWRKTQTKIHWAFPPNTFQEVQVRKTTCTAPARGYHERNNSFVVVGGR